MAEAWGDEDEVVDEWGTEDESVESVEAATPPPATAPPTPDTGEAPQAARPSWNMFGQRMDYPEPGTPGAKVAAGAFAEGAEALAGVPELIATLGSTIAAEPISGLAGLYTELSPGTAPGSGADTARAVQEAMTIGPQSRYGQKAIGAVGSALEPLGEAFTGVETFLGDAAYEVTGSPGMAAAAAVIPTAAAELLGLSFLKKPSRAAELAKQQQAAEKAGTTAGRTDEIVEDLRKVKTKNVVEDVRADPEIVAAAASEGLDLDPSHMSTNESFIRVVQALKSAPDNPLEAKEAKLLRDMGERADNIIAEIEGYSDRALLEGDIRQRIDNSLEELKRAETEQFEIVNEAIPPRTRVTADVAKQYIQNRMEELGDNAALLTTAEKQLLKVVQGDNLTYGALDALRRDVGAGYKRQGPFKDDTTGTLDQVYGVVAADQQRVANAFKVGQRYRAGNDLTIQRKLEEQSATKMYGKALNQSFVSKLASGVQKLTKGDVSTFNDMMKRIPPDMQQKAAATMLSDLFTSGMRRRGESLGLGFSDAYAALERNPTAKRALFKYLPKETQDRFDAIGKVSQGIARAKAFQNTSRTANALLANLENGGLVERVTTAVMQNAARVTAWTMGGHHAAGAADTIMRQTRDVAKRQNAANELLASPQFMAALDKAMEGKERQANMMLKRSKAWQRFRDLTGEGTRQQLAAMGPIAWLTQQDEQAEQPNVQ